MTQNSPPGKGPVIGLGALILSLPIVVFFEGYMPRTYIDPVGVPTVCYGETDKTITMQQRFSKEECLVLLGGSLQKHAAEVSKCVLRPIKDHEAAAILSWSYNVGSSAACGSTLMRKLNAGEPSSAWCPELYKWVYAKGKVLKGLERRRVAEYKMCIGEPHGL